jgi:putative DNA primase/helicase
MSQEQKDSIGRPGAMFNPARDAIERFRTAMGLRGIIAPAEIVADGCIHRCDAEGKSGKGDASYLLHLDGIPAGGFENWRDGQGWEDWRFNIGRALLPLELDALREKAITARRERDAQKEERHAAARSRARRIWNRAKPADNTHPYLVRKGVSAHGLRVYKSALVVALYDAAGEIHSLQFIGAHGDKRFLKGGRVAGLYFPIGRPNGVLCIAEGYATAASVHAATGYAVAVAFNANNLEPVARALREKYPGMQIILCADDDTSSGRNVGLDKAHDAARVIEGLVAVPDFGADRPQDATDFNDMAKHCGVAAVARAIANATAPAGVENDDAPTHESAGRIACRRASDIQAKPIHWLWPNRIARGKVSMIAGNPGLGKSQVTVSMAAVVSTGSAWPVERTRCERGNVIVLSAEDDAEDTIVPRLEAARADLSRVYILGAVVESYQADGGEVVRAFNLKTDLTRLGALLAEIGNVAMVIIDPVTAYLGDTNSHNNAEIRVLLAPLSDLAAKHGAAVVCVSHLNKSVGAEALMRVTGSTAFVAAARAAFIVVKDPENEARRLLLPLKNNIGNDQTGLAFSLQSAQVRSAAGPIETSCVVWESGTVTVTADEAMVRQCDPEERNDIEDAKEFLRDLLADGPVSSRRIRADAEGSGYSWRTIQRAKKAVGIEAVKEGMKGAWVWKLPTKDANKTEERHANNVAAFGNLGTLRQNSGAHSSLVEVEI